MHHVEGSVRHAANVLVKKYRLDRRQAVPGKMTLRPKNE